MEHRKELSPLMRLPAELLTHVLELADHRTLRAASLVSKDFHDLAENAHVEGSQVKLSQLNGEMQTLREYQKGGFHGSTRSKGKALYAGDPEALTTHGTLDDSPYLGDGLYMDPTPTAALARVKDIEGDPKKAYRVLTKGLDERDFSPWGGFSCENDGVYDEEDREGAKMIQRHVYDKAMVCAPYMTIDGDEPDDSPETREFQEHRATTGVRLVPEGPSESGRLDPDFLAGIAARLRKK
jgi:hypothetical protein